MEKSELQKNNTTGDGYELFHCYVKFQNPAPEDTVLYYMFATYIPFAYID